MVKELSEMAPGSLDSQCLKLMIVLWFPPSLYCSQLALSLSHIYLIPPFPPFALLTDLLNAFQRILVQVCIVTCSKIIILQALMSRRANTFFLLFQ